MLGETKLDPETVTEKPPVPPKLDGDKELRAGRSKEMAEVMVPKRLAKPVTPMVWLLPIPATPFRVKEVSARQTDNSTPERPNRNAKDGSASRAN